MIDSGYTDKKKILDRTTEHFNKPRPTVRRNMRMLRLDLQNKVDILNGIGHKNLENPIELVASIQESDKAN